MGVQISFDVKAVQTVTLLAMNVCYQFRVPRNLRIDIKSAFFT